MNLRIAVVLPRFGDVSGGAELLGRWLAERLAQAGHSIDVLTTCAIDHYTWRNVLPEGVERHGMLTVKRFPTNARDLDLHRELEHAIREEFPLTISEELLWLRHGVSSARMEEELDRNGHSYDLILALPYLFGTTYFSLMTCRDRAVVIPCLHDEAYARTKFVRNMLSGVRGIIFNTRQEAQLAERLAPTLAPWSIVGLGFEAMGPGDTDSFRRRHRLQRPFLVYVGRREGGKNLPQLFEYFLRYKSRRKGALALAVAGSGAIPLPSSSDVKRLKINWDKERDSLYRSAMALCQPSVNESFSIVLMQSWLAERPVLVHGRGEVTRYHCEQSNGGLWYSNYGEFEEILELFEGDSNLRQTLGRNGRAYVETEYSWEAVLSRFNEAVAHLIQSPTAALNS